MTTIDVDEFNRLSAAGNKTFVDSSGNHFVVVDGILLLAVVTKEDQAGGKEIDSQ